jgi:hypothetical protein
VRNYGQDSEGRDGEERVVRHFGVYEILSKLGGKVQCEGIGLLDSISGSGLLFIVEVDDDAVGSIRIRKSVSRYLIAWLGSIRAG